MTIIPTMVLTSRSPRLERSSHTSPLNAIGATLEVAAAATLVVTAVTGLVLRPGDSISFLTISYLVANLLLYTSVVCLKDRGGVSVMIGFFFLLFVAIPARVQIESSTFPFGSTYTSQDLVSTYVVLSIAQIAFMLGTRLDGSPRRMSQRLDVLSTSKALRFVLFLTALNFVIIGAVGPSVLFSTRGQLADMNGLNEGIDMQLLFMGRSLSLVALLTAIIVSTRVTPAERRRASLWMCLTVSIVTCLALNYPPSLPRFQLLGAVLAILGILINLYRPLVKLIFTALAVLFLFFLFPALKVIGSGKSVDFGSAFANDVSEYLLRVDFDGFKQIADTVIYLQSHSIRFGENILGVFLFWVPRSFWPGKPMHSGAVVSSALGYPYINVSSPLPAEAALAFGPAGILIILGVFGYFVARVERRTRAASRDEKPIVQLVLYALLIGFSTIIMRGAINSVAPMFMTAFAAYLALRFFSSRPLLTSTNLSWQK